MARGIQSKLALGVLMRGDHRTKSSHTGADIVW